MSFKPILQQLLAGMPDALGAIIVDFEGEAVDQVATIAEDDLKVLAAHNGIILSLLRAAAERVAGAQPEEVIIRTAQGRVLILPLAEDYLLLVQLQRDALVARALGRMRACAAQLHGAMAL